MRNWIEIDGKTSRDFGLAMARLPLWTAAAETVENITLPGVAVEMDRHTGQYQDFNLTLTGYLTRPPMCGDFPKLIDWLQNGKQLVMSTQPQIYGVIRKVGQITPKRIGTRANEIQIPFTFNPFKYTRENIPETFDTSPAYIHVWGNVYCEPVYRLTVDPELTGAALFTVNGETVTILNPAIQTGTVIIDIPRRKIYMEENGVLTIVQTYTTGDFWKLVLVPGSNTISWNSHVTAVSVTVNERWL